MADTIAIKVTADVVELQTKFALAKAESAAFAKSLNDLARQAVAAGSVTPELQSKLLQAAAAATTAKDKMTGLQQAMKGGATETRSFAGAIALAREGLGALGVAISAGAIIAAGKSVYQSYLDVGRGAELLHMSTLEYQAFSKSAQNAGVEVDASSAAMKRFEASQGDALSGVGDQAKAFNDLNVSARLPAQEALPMVARALLAIRDPARRTRDEIALFGRSGQDVESAMAQWARGVPALATELQKLGQMQSKDLVEAAQKAKTEMDAAWMKAEVSWGPSIVKLTQMVSGLGDAIAAIPTAANSADKALRDNYGLSGAPEKVIPDVAPGYTPVHHKHADGSRAIDWKKDPPDNFKDENDKKNAEEAARRAADTQRQVEDVRLRTIEEGALRRIQAELSTNNFMLSMGRESIEQWRAIAEEQETARYQVELDYFNKRIAADKNDKVRLAADLASRDQLQAEHSQNLLAIDQEYQEKRQQQEDAAYARWRQQLDQRLAVEVRGIDRSYAAHLFSAQERYQLELTATRQVEEQELARFDAEHQGLVKGTAAYEQAMQERQEISDKFAQSYESMQDRMAEDTKKAWAPVTSGFNSMVGDLMSGNTTLVMALGRGAAQIAQNWIEAQIEMVEESLITEGAKTQAAAAGSATRQAIGATEHTSFLGYLAESVAEWLGLETAKTVDTTAGAATRVTANATEAASGIATAKIVALAEIPAYTGVAAMGAAAAMAPIPFVGPALAAAAFAEMQGLGAAALGLASLDVGTNFVPNDMIAQIHAGERIIPAADNRDLMNAVSGGGNGGGGDVHVHIHANDAQSMLGQMNTIKRQVGAMVADVWNLNPSLRPKY